MPAASWEAPKMLAPLPAPSSVSSTTTFPRGREPGYLDGSWGKLTNVLRQKNSKIRYLLSAYLVQGTLLGPSEN